MGGRCRRSDSPLTVALSVIKSELQGRFQNNTTSLTTYMCSTQLPSSIAELQQSMDEGKRRKRSREEEIVETALAAAGAALFVSGLKKILPHIGIGIQWPVNLTAAPSPLLFLLLHVIIASIVIISTTSQPNHHVSRSDRRRTGHRKRSEKRRASSKTEDEKKSEYNEEEDGGDAEELNARVEAFIVAFRQQLMVDSFGSRGSSEACSSCLQYT